VLGFVSKVGQIKKEGPENTFQAALSTGVPQAHAHVSEMNAFSSLYYFRGSAWQRKNFLNAKKISRRGIDLCRNAANN
jgi:hypothetical protein